MEAAFLIGNGAVFVLLLIFRNDIKKLIHKFKN